MAQCRKGNTMYKIYDNEGTEYRYKSGDELVFDNISKARQMCEWLNALDLIDALEETFDPDNKEDVHRGWKLVEEAVERNSKMRASDRKYRVREITE